MNVTGDFEIIKSALLAGSINDAMWKIRSARKKAESAFQLTKKEKYSYYVQLMDTLAGVLSGKKSLTDLRAAMKSEHLAEFMPGTNQEGFIDTFLFYLEYAMDRYNVQYPEYDEKRCADA